MARRELRLGAQIGQDLALLGVVDDGPHPVYLVWHRRAWCPMACKVFRSLRRARAEARLLRRLDHPNIVRCLGVSEPAHLLMEYLEGPTLRALMRSRPSRRLSIADAARVAIYVGSALLHMHDRGFVHLDVKPANLVISDGRPVLFDLGTATPHEHSRLRQQLGTDAYMSPEQCAKGRVTPAADVFALGVTLYEMLSGALPFGRGTQRLPFPQLTRAAVPLKRHRPRAPQALDELIAACLARDPRERPPLPVLLPRLHEFISSGAPMWPVGFDPGCAVAPGNTVTIDAAKRNGPIHDD